MLHLRLAELQSAVAEMSMGSEIVYFRVVFIFKALVFTFVITCFVSILLRFLIPLFTLEFRALFLV